MGIKHKPTAKYIKDILPEFPISPIKPYIYLLNDNNLWEYNPISSSWVRLDKSIGRPIKIRILTKGTAEGIISANTVDLDNQELPTELLKYVCKKTIAHQYKSKAKITGSVTSMTAPGAVGDFIKITFNADIFDNINLSACTNLSDVASTITSHIGDEICALIIPAGNLCIKSRAGDRGASQTVTINYGINDTNGNILNKIGFTDGQSDSGVDGTIYPNRKGARYIHYNMLPLNATSFCFTKYIGNSKEYKFCNWARDKNNNIIRFNISTESILVVKSGYESIWSTLVFGDSNY